MIIDFNALLAQHPEIAKYLLILFCLSEGLAMLPATITRANSVCQLIANLFKPKP